MSRLTERDIEEAHLRHFRGDDYQRIAWDIANGMNPPLDPDTEEGEADWLTLEGDPEDECECASCKAYTEGYDAAEEAFHSGKEHYEIPVPYDEDFKVGRPREAWLLGLDHGNANIISLDRERDNI